MILLTGASGYLGRHVAERLRPTLVPFRELGGPRTALGIDLSDATLVAALMRELRPMLVLHCAALVDYENESAAADSAKMARYIRRHSTARIVFASTMSIHADTAYANGKRKAERVLKRSDVILRLSGLFGLPRRSGVIYEACQTGHIPESFGPYPAMHVADAAEYLARAATMPSDGKPEPFSVTYGDKRLTDVYGPIDATFEQRVREFAEQLREVPA